MNSYQKREIVKKDYDLIAEQYCNEFGIKIKDKEIIEQFEKQLKKKSKIIDLGGGPGQVTKYLIDKGYDAICYDFSKEMKKKALSLYPELPYILDDIININKHFSNNTIDGIIALYSIFHVPKEELRCLFNNISLILKDNGVFFFSYKLGNEEKLINEPYLKEKGKDALYIHYDSKEEINELLSDSNFKIIFEKEKNEKENNALNKDGNNDIFIIAKKQIKNDRKII